ncbi:MAG: tyrosine--tRNA ligase [Actinomycetota bacterium]
MDLFEDLRWRGLAYQWTGEDALPELLNSQKIRLYIGFDPSADSLTIGNLLVLILLRRFQAAGHVPIAVVGGATGMVGDPSGRSAERNLLSPEQLEHNKQAIRSQMERFLDFEGPSPAIMADNADWLGSLSFIDFLRDVGKHASVNTMLARDSVKARLEAEAGISFTEFSYMLMQAYDFVHLNRTYGCVLQCGASDQFGNIVAGIDLARRLDGTRLFGLTTPLVTRSDGQKIGKTADGATWLDPEKTSPYRLYQWFVRVPDEDAGRFLRYYTDLSHEEILDLETQIETAPAKRAAQLRLAEEVTRLVHGEKALIRAKEATEVLFGGSLDGLSGSELLDIFADVPSTQLPKSRLGDLPLSDALVETGLVASKSEARRRLDSGGIYLNNQRVEDPGLIVGGEHLVADGIAVLRSGKRSFALLRFA